MAGRRLREAVREVTAQNETCLKQENTIVANAISGLKFRSIVNIFFSRKMTVITVTFTPTTMSNNTTATHTSKLVQIVHVWKLQFQILINYWMAHNLLSCTDTAFEVCCNIDMKIGKLIELCASQHIQYIFAGVD